MRKKFVIRESVPFEELESYMRRWEKRAPGYVLVYEYAKSGDYPIYCAKMTDPEIPDCEKEIAIVIAEHSGSEISGMNAVLGVGNILSGLGKEAKEILASQIIYIIPCHNPYSYNYIAKNKSTDNGTLNQEGYDEYTELFLEYVDPQKKPAAFALKNLIDTLKPEALFDSHGVWYKDQIMLELCGNYSFAGSYRYPDQRFSLEQQKTNAEYGYHTFDMGDQQLLPPTNPWATVPQYQKRFGDYSPSIVGGAYGYVKYHTFSGSHEVSFEESGTIMILKALHLGSQVWKSQRAPGYPVQIMKGLWGLNQILVGGDNAEERRNSRVELWNNLQHMSTGLMHPEMPGLSAVVFSTNVKKCKKVFPDFNGHILMDTFMDNLDNAGFMDTSKMKAQLDNHWDGVNVSMSFHYEKDWKIKNGITLRLGLPYNQAEPTEVLLNGELLFENSHNGYTITKYGPIIYVDIHIPKDSDIDFAVCMVRYNHEDRYEKTKILDIKNTEE